LSTVNHHAIVTGSQLQSRENAREAVRRPDSGSQAGQM